jgi:hypothetical protein
VKTRQGIPKSVRFEVFKRDAFKCVYCGAAAPDVLLQLDHIQPVSKDGTDDILNLVTACAACNSGKSDVLLDDKTAVAKARGQMEELQERREQLELLMQWREGLRDLADETIDRVSEYWYERAPGWHLSDHGKGSLRRLLRKFSLPEITAAMDIAADHYLELADGGGVTRDSWNEAWNKIPGICRVQRESEKDPDIRDLYYIRGILRKRIPGYFDDPEALEWLRAARSWNVPIDELRRSAFCVRNWTQFKHSMCELIDRQKELEDLNGSEAQE